MSGNRFNSGKLSKEQRAAARAAIEEQRSVRNEILDGLSSAERRIVEHQRALRERYQSALKAGNTDAMTGVANRGYFDRRLEEAVADVNAGRSSYAVLIADLAGLKAINDSLAPAAGDAAIAGFAAALDRISRASETVARIGGDEFAMILDNPNENANFPKNAENRVKDALSKACFVYGEHAYPLRSYVAVYDIPKGLTAEQVYDEATGKINDMKALAKHDRTKFDLAPIDPVPDPPSEPEIE